MKTHYKKPFYKTLIKTRKNVLTDPKIFGFKKKKWADFQFFAKKKIKFFKRYRLYDQSKLTFTRFAGRGNSFKKHFQQYLFKSKVVKILYGINKKKNLKKLLLKPKFRVKKTLGNTNTVMLLERRLDNVVYKSKFSSTIKHAQQMILHGHIELNGKKIKSNNCFLKHGDVVSVKKCQKSRDIVRSCVFKNNFWPIPPKYLKINFRTLTVVNTAKEDAKETIFLPFNANLNFVKNKLKFK